MGGTADILKSIGGTAVIKIYLGGIPDICRYYYYYLSYTAQALRAIQNFYLVLFAKENCLTDEKP